MEFELNKDTLEILYKNDIVIEFKTIKQLALISKEIKKLGFYCGQTIADYKLLKIFKNYKEYCISRSITNFTGKEEIKGKITFIEDEFNFKED